MLLENQIEYDDTRTCGFIVRTEVVQQFFRTKLKMDDYTINKIPDYIKKCNDHKHKKEKTLSIDSVINYLKVYYDFVNYYLDYIKGIRIFFNTEYFVSIFGETEKLNHNYKTQMANLRDELNVAYDNKTLSEQNVEMFRKLLSIKEIEVLSLDEQNQRLKDQIDVLKDIKLNSLEVKLNKALDLLINLNSEILENRFATTVVYRSITGLDIKKAIEKEKKENS